MKIKKAQTFTWQRTAFAFPMWKQLRHAILPTLDQLFRRRLGIADWDRKVLRMQINRMPNGSAINQHADNGFYSVNSHRYHVPLIVPKCVRFEQKTADGQGAWAWGEAP